MSWSNAILRRLARRHRRSIPLAVDGLEARIALSTFDVATESQLRAAITVADSNSSSENTIDVIASITLSDTGAGELLVQNATSTAKALTIEGQGTSPADAMISGGKSWDTRIFEVISTEAASVTVIFKDLAIEGGRAHDGGAQGGTAALGGGLLIDGGDVSLSNVAVSSNAASGADGADGATKAAGKPGGSAQGGGIYLGAGQLTLTNSEVSNNQALGGTGGKGGNWTSPHAPGSSGQGTTTSQPTTVGVAGTGGNGESKPAGGAGGDGGSGAGGGIYVASGQLSLIGSTVSRNKAGGGDGGDGGNGFNIPLGQDGDGTAGGAGGAGGMGAGGGIYVASDQLSLTSSTLESNSAQGGEGGNGGLGGTGGPTHGQGKGIDGVTGGAGGDGGDGSAGGLGAGGGLYLAHGQLNLVNTKVASNKAIGGDGGSGGSGNWGGQAGHAVSGGIGGVGGAGGIGGDGGKAGSAQGGGLYLLDPAQASMITAQFSGNQAHGGKGGAGGVGGNAGHGGRGGDASHTVDGGAGGAGGQGGRGGAGGAGGAADGGSVFLVAGSLTLSTSTLMGDAVQAGSGGEGGAGGFGGQGGFGATGGQTVPRVGADGCPGGAGGSDGAGGTGGNGGAGGIGAGGGLYLAAGTMTLTLDAIKDESATGGAGAVGGVGGGGYDPYLPAGATGGRGGAGISGAIQLTSQGHAFTYTGPGGDGGTGGNGGPGGNAGPGGDGGTGGGAAGAAIFVGSGELTLAGSAYNGDLLADGPGGYGGAGGAGGEGGPGGLAGSGGRGNPTGANGPPGDAGDSGKAGASGQLGDGGPLAGPDIEGNSTQESVQLVVSNPPLSSVAASTPFAMSVALENTEGQVDVDFDGNMTLSLSSDPGGATLGGTLTATAIDGVASFSGLTLGQVGTGYAIEATAGTAASGTVTSPPVSINVTETPTPTPTPTAPTITWANPAGITYGAPLSPTQLDATAGVPGTFSYSPPPGTVLKAGSDSISVTFTPNDTTDYKTVTGMVTIVVAQATPTITWTAPQAIASGTALSSSQLDATASVPGTFTYSPAPGTIPSVGTDTLSVTFTPSDSIDYKKVSATVELSVLSPTPTPNPTPSPTPTPTPTPPLVISQQPVFQRKLNKKGKPVGKAALSGFTLDFATPLDPSAATDAANYQVNTVTTRKVKKKVEHILHPITDFTVSYSAAGDSVTIVFGSPETFPTGGQVVVLGGVTGGSGGSPGGPTLFSVSRGGKSIAPS